MRSFAISAMSLLCLAFWTPMTSMPQERDRGKIPDAYKWDLTAIYSSDAAWREAKRKFAASLSGFEAYQGTLNKSAEQLAGCLDLLDRLNVEFARMFAYANLSLDQDMRVASNAALQQETDQLGAMFGEKTAFIEPEILAIDAARVRLFLGDRRLDPHRHYLDDLLRRQAHTGTEGEEKIIAVAELMSEAPSSIRDLLVNTDFPYPKVILADGKTVTIDPSEYSRQRRSPNREDREKASAAYLGKLNEYRRTFGALLNAQVMKDLFETKARKYGSCLESSLDGDNIPVQVFRALVANVNGNLGTLHRYLKLRQRILGLDELHYYDLAAPLTADAARSFSFEEAKGHILAAFRPLGEGYVAAVQKAFAGRWIDIYPTEGKRSGGYSNGWAYNVHPYILFNYNGTFDDMSGLAHELGHAMQSHLSNARQPFTTATCPRFVTEVASTFNEALLIDAMLKQTGDDEARLSMLGNYLDGFAVTIFRATLVSEFELLIHEMAEKGEQLTGDGLNRLYLEITRKYYGHDRKVCVVDDDRQADWTAIPQLYYDFYAYQYATAFTASAALSELVLSGDKAATRKYLDFLSAGGSDYAINLLKKAGVDMTASEPFALCMAKMNRVMDEMEKILTRKKG
ncbi:MAG: oligoendopeptidase F [Acidobacteriota bacterium]|nr:oligoendopeptidase F [Acidobacteriota bacterium]